MRCTLWKLGYQKLFYSTYLLFLLLEFFYRQEEELGPAAMWFSHWKNWLERQTMVENVNVWEFHWRLWLGEDRDWKTPVPPPPSSCCLQTLIGIDLKMFILTWPFPLLSRFLIHRPIIDTIWMLFYASANILTNSSTYFFFLLEIYHYLIHAAIRCLFSIRNLYIYCWLNERSIAVEKVMLTLSEYCSFFASLVVFATT